MHSIIQFTHLQMISIKELLKVHVQKLVITISHSKIIALKENEFLTKTKRIFYATYVGT